jgi:hypothetical protein
MQPKDKAGGISALFAPAVELMNKESSPVQVGNTVVSRAFYVLYVAFNTMCTIVFAYQIYLWFKTGAWVRIATYMAVPDWLRGQQLLRAEHGAGSLLRWMMDVEIGYTLGILATIFYLLKLFQDRANK